MTGQDLTTTAIIGLEAFLSNNVKFEDTDDFITFVNNVKSTEHSISILNYVDEPISKQELLDYILTRFNTERVDKEAVQAIISKMTPELVNRVYYTNQLQELLKNTYFIRKFSSILQYVYTDSPAPEIVEDLEELKMVILDLCWYDWLFEERYKKAAKYKRQTVITIDTDSVFINVNKYVEQITSELNLDISNKDQQGSIVNVFINITTGALKKLFITLTTNMGLVDDAKPLINMKQEFLYQKILLTRNKKNYGGIITAELGKRLTKPVLDIKGLAIKKTVCPKPLREKFTNILKNDILEPEQIDLSNIIHKYDEIALDIEDSLRQGKTEYTLPKNVELIESYKTPDTIEAVRAAITWNALEPNAQIIPPEKINIIKLRPELLECFSTLHSLSDIDAIAKGILVDGFTPEAIQLCKQYPDKAKAIAKVIYNIDTNKNSIDISRFGLSCIAVPKGNESIPEYIRPFIDFKNMVNNNMTHGLVILESLGIYVESVATTKYKSNIISI